MTTNILPALNDFAAFAINYVKISLRNLIKIKKTQYEPLKSCYLNNGILFLKFMRTVLNLYKKFYEIPEEVPSRFVLSHFAVVTIFFFTLGFTVSQVIIFLVER